MSYRICFEHKFIFCHLKNGQIWWTHRGHTSLTKVRYGTILNNIKLNLKLISASLQRNVAITFKTNSSQTKSSRSTLSYFRFENQKHIIASKASPTKNSSTMTFGQLLQQIFFFQFIFLLSHLIVWLSHCSYLSTNSKGAVKTHQQTKLFWSIIFYATVQLFWYAQSKLCLMYIKTDIIMKNK